MGTRCRVTPGGGDPRESATEMIPRALVPVGKSCSGFTDAEMRELDHFVRDNTVERFGPVRPVTPKLAFEVAFDAVQR